MDGDGNPSQIMVPHSEYKKRLISLATTVKDSVFPILKKHDHDASWMLRTVVFGIAINAQLSLGPFKVGAMPEMRFVFSNIKDSFVP